MRKLVAFCLALLLAFAPFGGVWAGTIVPVRELEIIAAWDFESETPIASSANANNEGAAIEREDSTIEFTYAAGNGSSRGLNSSGSTIVTDPNGASIPIYRAAAYPDGVSAGDKVDVYAVASKYNTTVQLRNGAPADYVQTDLPYIPIAEALALAEGETTTVRGVVIFVEGRNVYVQDATGGIDLYLNAAHETVKIGDLVEATGVRAAFKGLPELSGIDQADPEVFKIYSSGNALPLETVTLEQLTADPDAYMCERIFVECAVLGDISNFSYTPITQNGVTVNIYKMPEVEPEAGDEVNVIASVGMYNDVQLRVANSADVTLYQPDPTPVPTTEPTNGYVSFAVESVTAEPDTDVSVAFTVNGEYSASALTMFINFDQSKLSVVGSLAQGEVWSDAVSLGAMAMPSAPSPGQVGLMIISPSADFSGSGTVFTVTLHVAADVQPGDVIPLELVIDQFTKDELDGTVNNIPNTVSNGSVTVIAPAATDTPAPTPEPTAAPTAIPTDIPRLVRFDFEYSSEAEFDWTLIDSDGDGYDWFWLGYGINQTTANMAYEGVGNLTSASYQGGVVLYPDNWAITPAVAIPDDATTLTFWVKGQDPSYADEHYAVYAGTAPTVSSMMQILPESVTTGDWVQKTIDISDYAGETVYFGFRHFNSSDMFRINLDLVEIHSEGEPVNPTPVPTATPAPGGEYPTPGAGEAVVVLEAEDVWGDGTGYQMLLDADANTYVSIIPTSGALTTGGNVSDAIYAEFEYKIPENADGNLNTSNIILASSGYVVIPAGTYDWCITNPTPGDRIWIASSNGTVPGRYDNCPFQEGGIYIFHVSFGGQNDRVDLTVYGDVDPLPDPTLTPEPTTNPEPTPTPGPTSIPTVDSVEFTVGSAEAMPGDVISIPVMLGGIDFEVHSFVTHLYFDPTCLELLSITNGEVIANRPDDAMLIKDYQTTPGDIAVGFICPTIPATYKGLFYTATFKVKETCSTDQALHFFVDEFYNLPVGVTTPIPYPVTVIDGMIWLPSVTVSFIGAYTGTQRVNPGQNAALPVLDAEGLHYTFTVNGEPWDGTNVTEDVTVEVGIAINEYTVTFFDPVANEVIETQTVEHGNRAIPPEPPEYEGCTFVGWDADTTRVTSDMVVNAIYDLAMLAVTFTDGIGNVLDEQSVPYGTAAEAPAVPEREGYTFAGWDADFSCVTEDMTVNALWEVRICTITYVGVYTGTDTVEYGGNVLLPYLTSPTMRYTFTVNGEPWDGTNVTDDVTVTVGVELITFTVTFLDMDGTVLKLDKVRPGNPAIAPEPPEHEGYTFIGWDKDFSEVTEDMTVTAVYQSASPTPEPTPPPPVLVVLSAASGWPGEEVSLDMTIRDYFEVDTLEGSVEYDASVLTLTGVTYGSILNDAADNGGTVVFNTETPGIIEYGSSGYQFHGSDYGFNALLFTLTFRISEDAEPETRSRLINQVSELGRHDDEGTYHHIYNAPCGGYVDICGEGTEPSGWRFTETDQLVPGAMYVLAAMTDAGPKAIKSGSGAATLESVTIRTVNGMPVIDTGESLIVWERTQNDEFLNGSRYLYPTSSSGVMTYTSGRAISWSNGHLSFYTSAGGTYYITQNGDGLGTSTNEDEALEFRLFVKTCGLYTVTFVDGVTGEEIAAEFAAYGESVTAPEPPEHEGYTFIGWDEDFSEVTEDMTVTAVYEYSGAPAGLSGDVDCDGLVTMADVTLLAMYLNGEDPEITAQGLLNADANGDGGADIRDIAAIYAVIAEG